MTDIGQAANPDPRPCTCHPDDRPPSCPRKYALTHCRIAALLAAAQPFTERGKRRTATERVTLRNAIDALCAFQ